MSGVTLKDHQVKALEKMKNGCILRGSVGSGKSRTALGYYYVKHGGEINSKTYVPMVNPIDLYIITTAKKRDSLDWEEEMLPFRMSTDPNSQRYHNKIVVDSWNNITKYVGVKNSFFIFDEQRVVGTGIWVKSFLKIASANQWILLSATPGDEWLDYVPVFIANGFFKNRTQFDREHAVYSPWVKFPKVMKYINEGRLQKMRNSIQIEMEDNRKTVRHNNWITVQYDEAKYIKAVKTRWNPYTDLPMRNVSEYCSVLRRISNESEDRIRTTLEIVKAHPKAIIFYSFDYELELLRKMCKDNDLAFTEWNGHKHEPVLCERGYKKWVYLVEYIAGSEAWNCIETDTIIFYSQSYSYRTTEQACGRIDRMNTPYKDLYYYHLKSMSSIDVAITNTLRRKKKFNERKFAPVFPSDTNDKQSKTEELKNDKTLHR